MSIRITRNYSVQIRENKSGLHALLERRASRETKWGVGVLRCLLTSLLQTAYAPCARGPGHGGVLKDVKKKGERVGEQARIERHCAVTPVLFPAAPCRFRVPRRQTGGRGGAAG